MINKLQQEKEVVSPFKLNCTKESYASTGFLCRIQISKFKTANLMSLLAFALVKG